MAPHSAFPTTNWSLIVAAGANNAALDELLTRYWRPVFAYLRATGSSSDDAAELTQAFIADVLMHRDLISRADAERGSFRGFLKTALRNFTIDTRRRDDARRRAIERSIVPADPEARSVADARLAESPVDAFDRLWAETVMNDALTEMREQLVGTGFARHWRVFESRIVAPATSGNDARSMRDLATEIGAESADDVSRLLFSAKRRFRSTLRRLIGQTMPGDAETDEELDVLLAILRRDSA